MLILASASPRRRELLAQIGLEFGALAADIDESRRSAEPPAAYVARLALEKARTIFLLHPEDTILGADTTVVLKGEVLNKPVDIEDAARMLRALASHTHQVHTGIAVVSAVGERTHVETTAVTFTQIREDELAAYLATGDSLDKAGGYGIQGFAAQWVARIDGDFFNVMGLPLAAVVRLLQDMD